MSETRPHPTRSIPVRTLRVDVVHGEIGRAPAAAQGAVVVGSACDCDVVLRAPSVSSYHAQLEAVREGIHVVDLGSTNGCVVGTTWITDAVVPPGTTLELGAATVVVSAGDAGRVEAAATSRLGDLITCSPAMRKLAARINALRDHDGPVLLSGPAGSGKELVARTLHSLSARAAEPFVVIDCGALSETLGAADLFGHTRGAFTDASEARAGALERAAGGTLVLDELGALPLALQPALLGVLERRSFKRLGGRDEIALGARVVATTREDLRRRVNTGAFRLDLYYRIAGARLEVPTLAQRTDDLHGLVGDILLELGHGPSHPMLQAESVTALADREFEGNVRELRHHVELAVAIGDAGLPVEPLALEDETLESMITRLAERPFASAKQEIALRFERAYVESLDRRAGRNVTRAAALSGLDRAELRRIAKRCGVPLGKRARRE